MPPDRCAPGMAAEDPRARPSPDVLCAGMVLPVRIELTTSALPRMRSTTELRQHCEEVGPLTVRALPCQPEWDGERQEERARGPAGQGAAGESEAAEGGGAGQ